ncbi:DUF2716 domain-containing protein [Catenulispora subtropica]|uniref:DUF2716 domain-containing protein n=1 Tax=Catenulispora subtropica TaxID=450798 RepID=A0ABN2SX92_9ACTN
MSEAAVQQLTTAESKQVWDRFDNAFTFRPSMYQFPAITEPTDSITWSLQALEDDPRHRKLDTLVTLIHGALAACTAPGNTLLLLEWQHTSYRLRPDQPPTDIFLPDAPEASPGWPRSPYPDGDYPILLAEDFTYGTFGHPWEHSLCLFGANLLAAAADEINSLLKHTLRRAGRPVPNG